jgi:hypothetical protein
MIVWANPNLIVGLTLPVALIAGWGLFYLLSRWQTLFPINPYAITAGLFIVSSICVVIGAINYNFYLNASRSLSGLANDNSLAVKTLGAVVLPSGVKFETDELRVFWQFYARKNKMMDENAEYRLVLTDGRHKPTDDHEIVRIIPSLNGREVFYLTKSSRVLDL